MLEVVSELSLDWVMVVSLLFSFWSFGLKCYASWFLGLQLQLNIKHAESNAVPMRQENSISPARPTNESCLIHEKANSFGSYSNFVVSTDYCFVRPYPITMAGLANMVLF
jgi:hypothetical protein